MISMFTKLRKGQGRWKVEGVNSTTTFYEAILPGNLNDDEITTIIQRLASKHLTEVRGRAGSNFRRVALAGAVGEDEILAR